MAIPSTARHRLSALACLALMSTGSPSGAQGLDSEQAIDTIIGSEVEEQQSSASDEMTKVVAAIENTSEATAAVRKISDVGKLEIVYLPDAAPNAAPAAIDEAVSRHEEEIAELRKEIEGNAMLFHAIDSRSILLRDVLAVSFEEDDAVIIYAAASKPE